MAPGERTWNTTEVLGRGFELFFQVLGLKMWLHAIGLFIHSFIANTLIDFEKLFKGLQFEVDRGFKY